MSAASPDRQAPDSLTRAARVRVDAQLARIALRVTLTECQEAVHEARRRLDGHIVEAADDQRSLPTRDDLRRALATRTSVGMALGIVMERFGLDPDAAWAYLRRLSNDENVRLADIAAELVAGRADSARD